MKLVFTTGISLYLAAVLQQSLPDRILLWGARPDFFLIITLCLGLLTRSPASIGIGFWAGLVQGAMVGANLGQFIVTRMISTYAASKINDFEIEIGLVLGSVFVGLGTVLAQILMMFLAPPRSLSGFLGDTIAMAMYNAVLAVPVYAMLRLVLRAPRA